MYYTPYETMNLLMELIGFMTRLAGDLAWPVAAIICVLILRGPLNRLADAIGSEAAGDDPP